MATLSIIVPVYNAEAYLADTVNSILKQTYTDYEVFLIDDGSQDHSAAICDDFSRLDTRIHVVHKENGGVSSARNTGLKLVNGDYIAFVDADDLVDPAMYETMIKALESSNADIAMCGLVSETAYTEPIQVQKGNIVYDNPLQLLLDEKLGTVYICNKIYRRNVIGDIRFDETIVYSEDQLFIAEVLIEANLISVVPQIFYHYMQHPGSLSWQDGTYEIWQGNFRARQSIFELIKAKSTDERICYYAFCEYAKAVFALLRYTIKYRDEAEYNRIVKKYGSVINKYVQDGKLPLEKKIEYKSYSSSYRLASLIHYYPKHIKKI